MFALEISFHDGVSNPEMIFVRRPQAVIGASDYAHVVIEDMSSLNYQIRLLKELGNTFRIQPVGGDKSADSPLFLEGVYQGDAALDLGVVNLHITSLDTDLLLKEGEPPDRAGVRILRQACALEVPQFPALVVVGANPVIISFVPEQAVYVGRGKRCALRLDSADISAEHARIGFESGEFWVEDLGSTNGTFVEGQQVSGRQNLKPETPVVLGREITVIGITSAAQLQNLTNRKAETAASIQTAHYPVAVSVSELVRPARLPVKPGSIIDIGRDPSNDMWIGAPHISRKHCSIRMSKTGSLTVTDCSTNGIICHGGKLKRDHPYEVKSSEVFDFGGGITIGLCFSKEDEQQFAESRGSFGSFGASSAVLKVEGGLPEGRLKVQSWNDSSGALRSSPARSGAGEHSRIKRLWMSYARAGMLWKAAVVVVIFCTLMLFVILGEIVYGGM